MRKIIIIISLSMLSAFIIVSPVKADMLVTDTEVNEVIIQEENCVESKHNDEETTSIETLIGNEEIVDGKFLKAQKIDQIGVNYRAQENQLSNQEKANVLTLNTDSQSSIIDSQTNIKRDMITDQETELLPNAKVSVNKVGIAIGDSISYSVSGLEVDAPNTHQENIMINLFSDNYDSSIHLDTIILPKITMVSGGQEYGVIYTVWSTIGTGRFEIEMPLDAEEETYTLTREKIIETFQGKMPNDLILIMRPLDDKGNELFRKPFESISMHNDIIFNYTVVDNGVNYFKNGSPLFQMNLTSEFKDGTKKKTLNAFVYYNTYDLETTAIDPQNIKIGDSVEVKYIVKNTGPYPISNMNIFNAKSGFVPNEEGWQETEDGYHYSLINELGKKELIQPGDSKEYTFSYRYEEESLESSIIPSLYTSRDFKNKKDFEVIRYDLEKELYTVYFDSMQGSDIKPLENIVIGSQIKEPSSPTRDNYEFEGWYTDKDFKIRWNFTDDYVQSDMTLYAQWKRILPQTEKPTIDEPKIENDNPSSSNIKIEKSIENANTVLPNTGIENSSKMTIALVLIGIGVLAIVIRMRETKRNQQQ